MLIFVLSLASCRNEILKSPKADNGFIDLSSWRFEDYGAVTLNGKWAFYWHQLLEPKDFKDETSIKHTGKILVFKGWKGYKVDGKPLPAKGFATYRLKIKMPPQPEQFALKILSMRTAYKLWINDQFVASNGTVALNKINSIPQYLPQKIIFNNDQEYCQITIQVSNFEHRTGGIWEKIQFGPLEQIENISRSQVAFDIFLFSGILVMGLYHFVLYALRRKDTSTFYFGMFCLVIAVRTLFLNEKLFCSFFSFLSWNAQIAIEYIDLYVTVPIFAMFVYRLYPVELPRLGVRFVQITAGCFIFILLFFPIEISIQTIPIYQAFILVYSACAVFILIRAILHKREGAIIFLTGFFILYAIFLNDILYSNGIIQTIFLAHFGLFVFISFQSFLLSRRFSKAFWAVEQMTDELSEKNIALKKLDKLKDEFLANTSHELRTPLNGIIGITESVLKGVAGKLSNSAEQNLSMVVSSAKRLSSLINDILDYSKLENRDITLNRKPVDIQSVVETVLSIFRHLGAGKNIIITHTIPSDLPIAYGDENRLQQILYNLVGNAVKFTNQGQITVSARQKGNSLEISITDTGTGIPRDRFEKIFQSFEQHQHPNARTSEGTGLGLSITKKLVELHEGEIWLESEIGFGSTFFFTLPISDEPIEKSHDARPTKHTELAEVFPVLTTDLVPPSILSEANEEKKRVLVVDDEPVNLQVVANFLSLEQIPFDTLSSGKKLLDRIENDQKPDLVLLDIMMPEMTGYEACRKLRAKYSSSELPIIMLTAKNRISDLVEGFESGANDYLTKPFSKDELLARVRSQLAMKQAFETLEENLQLKREIKQQKQTEQRLLMMQRKLSDMLDTVPDLIMAVNESGKVGFCNQSFQEVTGYTSEKLLGKSYLTFFKESRDKSLKAMSDDLSGDHIPPGIGKNYPKINLLNSKQKKIPVDVLIMPLDLEDEQLNVLIMRSMHKAPTKRLTENTPWNSLDIIKELNQNRDRIQQLEASLSLITPATLQEKPELMKDLKTVDTALEKIGTSLQSQEDQISIPQNVVNIMKLSVGYWMESSGTSKTDLAKASGCWKIHTDHNGWERARTMDKYLDINTCPQKPRLTHVINTAYFVLANCHTPSVHREQLETFLSRLTRKVK